MNEQINLATRDGIRTAELFTTFDSRIAGETFTFAIHRHLSCTNLIKISELNTGMGVAEIPFHGLVPCEPPSIVEADLTSQGQVAVAELIQIRGEAAVADVLLSNRLAAQVLNERGRSH